MIEIVTFTEKQGKRPNRNSVTCSWACPIIIP